MNHDESRALYDRALSVLAGGVNSSVRATQPYPFFVERGDGAHVIDADGNRYVDYVMGYGPLLYGHDAPEPVQSAVQKHAAAGPMYGAPTEIEVEHAEFVARHVPSVEMLRFVNSGTEATVSAVRLARGVTGRDKIVVMQGGYHGAQESTLVEGEGDHTAPSSPGIPESFAEHTLTVPFNDEEAAREVFAEHGDDIAAVLTEPILGNTGIVHPVDGYLEPSASDRRTRRAPHLRRGHHRLPRRRPPVRAGQVRRHARPHDVREDYRRRLPRRRGRREGRTRRAVHPRRRRVPVGHVLGPPGHDGRGPRVPEVRRRKRRVRARRPPRRKLRAGITDILEDQAPEYTVVGTDSMFKTVFTRHGAERPSACETGCRSSNRVPTTTPVRRPARMCRTPRPTAGSASSGRR